MLLFPAADYSVKDVAVGIRKGLTDAGVDVVDYPLAGRLALAARALSRDKDDAPIKPDMVNIQLLACEALPFQAAMHGVDWVLGIHGVGIHQAALVALRRIGVKIAWWFTEAPYESSEDRELHLARHVDVAFVNERSSVALFQKQLDEHRPGAVAHYLRHAYDPATHYPRDAEDLKDEERCDVLFIGTGFTERQHLFECVDWSGINLHLGGAWLGVEPNYRLAEYLKYSIVQNAETARLYSGAKIVVNCHRDGGAAAESANPRVWEAAACGAFQISDRRQEIADVLGDAVPFYAAGVPWRFITTIRRWLADDAGRTRLAALARERVQGETFLNRARTIVDALSDFESSRRGSRQQLAEVT